MAYSINLMDFSDCVLLQIFENLNSTDLFSLSRVNQRLENLIQDNSLWKEIDARSGTIDVEKNAYCLERLGESSKLLCARGKILESWRNFQNFPKNLTVLALENQTIDGYTVTLNDFPKNLRELSFRNSRISNSAELFKRTSENMESLKVLLLDGCQFVNCSVIMSISKYKNLETLSFFDCAIGNSIPYFSIAAWHGFKSLKILDVRLSDLGNTFLRSLVRCPKLKAFYFQNRDTSCAFDYNASKKRENLLSRDEESEDEIEFRVLESTDDDDEVTDQGTMELRSLKLSEKLDNEIEWKSYLYSDPYAERCHCGDQKQSEAVKTPEIPEDLQNWGRSKIKVIRHRRRRKKSCENGCENGVNDSNDIENGRKRRKNDSGDTESERKRQKCSEENSINCGAGTSSQENRPETGDKSTKNNEQDTEKPTVTREQRAIVVRNLCFGLGGINVIRRQDAHRDGDAPAPKEPRTEIRRLSLRGFQRVTDLSLDSLRHLNLTLLDVTHTRVTLEGLERFLAWNPDCRVVHEAYCRCIPKFRF